MYYNSKAVRDKELPCYHIDGAWLSLVERCVRDAEVAGSNPVAPILKTPQIVSDLWGFVCLCKNFRLLFQ